MQRLAAKNDFPHLACEGIRGHVRRTGTNEIKPFGAHGDFDRIADRPLDGRWNPPRRAVLAGDNGHTVLAGANHAAKNICVADEPGDERRSWLLVDLGRRADLHHATSRHHGHAIAHGERLFLVMRYEDEGDAEGAIEFPQLELHLLAKLQVECRERLVEQQDPWFQHEGASQRHPLPLAARQFGGAPIGIHRGVEAHEFEGAEDSIADRRFRDAVLFEPERNVLRHTEVGKERVVLEHHPDRTLVGPGSVHDPALHANGAAVKIGIIESGKEAQRRGLAASRGPEQRKEFTLGDVERHLVDGRNAAEGTGNALERQDGHGREKLPCPYPARSGGSTFGAMQNPFPAATASELADATFQALITAGLAVFALDLFRRLQQRWMAWWAAAWALYVLRLGAIIVFLRTGDRIWLFWHQVATGWVALAILWAALVFSRDARWRRGYAALALVPPIWAWIAIHALDQPDAMLLVALPVVVLIAGVTLWTGWLFWRHAEQTRSRGARFVAVAFALWGLHHLDYTVLRARGAWEPWGYFLDILFELAVGIGFGLMVLSELAERLAIRTGDLGRLSALMVRQHEAERRRLSRDLHDETAQTLSAVKMEIGMLREGAEADAIGRLDHVLHLVDDGIRGIRRVMNDLRPALLDDLGLMPAIESLASDLRDRGELMVQVFRPESAPRLAPDAELALFRAAQEALANVVRHAGASHVTLRLVVDHQSLRLIIEDDGCGLAPSSATTSDPGSHLGLAGMRERIAALGGKTTIGSAQPSGVVVSVELPIG